MASLDTMRNANPQSLLISVLLMTFSFSQMVSCALSKEFSQSSIRSCVCTPSFSVGYNGRIQGFFKGKRGLRQGDPLSPYLFVIAMNWLSLMLNKGAENGVFGYHEKCKSSKLTHLCFADDLLIFTDGKLCSVQGVLSILNKFATHSGLTASIQKTSFVSSGLSQDQIDLIGATTGLTHGSLPVRYLGIPLCSQKLSLHNCAPLLQHIKDKVNSWSTRSLSFAGRLLLLNTVIAGVTNFWSSTFVLPKACISKINSLCGAFLWHGSAEGSHSARVSWETVTLAKEEGSIWVTWYKAEVLKGSLSNFWITKEKKKNSWFTNKLLKLGSIDDWITVKKFLAPVAANSMGIPLSATLHNLFVRDRWNIRPARSDRQVQIQAFLSSVTLSQLPDEYEWTIEGAIWNSGGVPRHSFHAWLVTLNRLPTRDRLLSWGLAVPATCLLCNQGDESRDHLFFSCSFSYELWIHHARRTETTPSTGWNDSLNRMQSLPGPPWRKKLQLIVWQAVIYSIWQERNARLHRNNAKTITTISSILDRTIRNKIHGSETQTQSELLR
ncbi:PREDICTED: uncharacterized protein LOC106338781 [Brassica oleracea var. oleracea]|uniref:uncharacterized protein LOC106338781 n=1 Tax=Brassica oleracea var. oleracea TaxID=109376 RepID=UPI0006A6B159|nr:PREDICTED: uncharacterized protein LOC106338781 [Brassica oleracea var. oleracea]